MTSRISILLRLKEIGRYRHFYIVLGFFLGPVPLGSIKDLPAATCGEIKASEGDEMANGKYWIYSRLMVLEGSSRLTAMVSHLIWTEFIMKLNPVGVTIFL